MAETRGQLNYVRGKTTNLPVTSTAVLTCPAAMSARLDSIWVSNPTGGAITVTLYHGADQIGTDSIAAGGYKSYTPDICLSNGEALNAKGSATGLNVWAAAEVVYLPQGG